MLIIIITLIIIIYYYVIVKGKRILLLKYTHSSGREEIEDNAYKNYNGNYHIFNFLLY